MSSGSIKDKPGLFPKNISTAQAKDTGMAMCLLALLVGYTLHIDMLILIAILLVLINMLVPIIFKPVARLWFGLSNVIGTIGSRILLTLVFLFLITPIGVIRRWMGKDNLKLAAWKQNRNSVFKKRYYRYTHEDLEKPY
ncbi:SxtJ family membrane protein [Thermodesulfobacteriota bacterium]